MRLTQLQEKLLLLIFCAPLFASAHVFNGWFFQQFELSSHISWVYLPAFLRVAYVLVLGPRWGFAAIFLGSLLLGGGLDENLPQRLINSIASGTGPVMALWLFRILKERTLQISRLSDVIQMCILYALLNALVHHLAWAYNQPTQLITSSQLPIMVFGDLAGAVLGAWVCSLVIRRLGLYKIIALMSQDSEMRS